MRSAGLGALVWGLLTAAPAAAAPALTMQGVNGARFQEEIDAYRGMRPRVVKVQVLLDRASISPGAIDGKYGGNTAKALRVYQSLNGLRATGTIDRSTWRALARDSQPVLARYVITPADVKGPFVEKIPTELRDQARLKRLAYTSAAELLAEKFHMSEELLKTLNRGVDLNQAGASIVVAQVAGRKPSGEVKTLVIDRKTQGVKAYDAKGRVIAYYPATVGSDEFPSPKGQVKVTAIAERPTFTLTTRLDYAKKKLKKGERLTIAPGPNNPVGIVWIDLNKEGYGIHGTPEPTRISKTASHGCVRLTNWDVRELAGLVGKGTPVVFG